MEIVYNRIFYAYNAKNKHFGISEKKTPKGIKMDFSYV